VISRKREYFRLGFHRVDRTTRKIRTGSDYFYRGRRYAFWIRQIDFQCERQTGFCVSRNGSVRISSPMSMPRPSLRGAKAQRVKRQSFPPLLAFKISWPQGSHRRYLAGSDCFRRLVELTFSFRDFQVTPVATAPNVHEKRSPRVGSRESLMQLVPVTVTAQPIHR